MSTGSESIRQTGVAHFPVIVPMPENAVGLQPECLGWFSPGGGHQQHKVGEARIKRRLHGASDLKLLRTDDVFIDKCLKLVCFNCSF
jgi:hypothetical protein